VTLCQHGDSLFLHRLPPARWQIDIRLLSDVGQECQAKAGPVFDGRAGEVCQVVEGVDSRGGFVIGAELGEDHAVIAVRGELAALAAAELRTMLEAAIDFGYLWIVVDLSGVSSAIPEGLTVLARVARHIAGRRGQLTVRCANGAVRSILEASGLGHLNVPDPFEHQSAFLDYDQALRLLDVRSAAGPSDLFDKLNRSVVDGGPGHGTDGALRLAVALAKELVRGADGASVSLRRHGILTTIAATDQTVLDMDGHQYASGQGPCVDASAEGREFYSGSLSDEQRWPIFTPQARALGINSILSFPLITVERPVGAINIYSRTPAAFVSADQQVASVLAAEASAILSDVEADPRADLRSNRLQRALRTRKTIAQAQGAIMEREGISESAAFTALRKYSQRTNEPRRDHARHVADSTRRPRREAPPDGVGAADRPSGRRLGL
jgi:anti-anti-sigma factor